MVFEDKALAHEIEEQDEEQQTTGCGVCGGCGGFCGWVHRNRILSILLFAGVGAGVGVGLSFWEPDDPTSKDVTIQWLGLIGDLFIRGLKCFVLPLVFVNVIIAVVEMMAVGKASSIGWYVTGLYIATTVMAAFFGTMSTLMFRGLYKTENFAESSPPYVQLGCTSMEGSFLAEMDDGSVMCSSDIAADDSNINWIIDDVGKTFVTANGFPSNIVGAFSDSNFAAVIFFAVLFGIALSRVIIHAKGKDSYLLGFLKECDAIFQLVLLWIIFLTPFAVCSLIAAAIGKQDDLPTMFQNIGYLIAVSLFGWGFQFVFTYLGFYYAMTRTNPFAYLKHIVPAQTMAFASASSTATIPSSLLAVKSSGKVPKTIARFVIPFGATVNMDGGAVYFVCACIWLAVLNGETVTPASFILLIIIATVGLIGTAPVPSASLVLIITAYNTVFNTSGIPDGFGYIFAIDWFMDRCRTVTNVTGDCVVAGIVAHRCPMGESEVLPKMMDEEEAPSSEEETADKDSDHSPVEPN